MKSFAAMIVLAFAIAGPATAQEVSTDNTTVLAKTAARSSGGNSWTERVVTIKAGDTLSAILRDLGATPEEIKAIAAVLGMRGRDGNLRESQKLRVLLSPVPALHRLQPVRVMLTGDQGIEAVVALSDLGRYVNVEASRFSNGISSYRDGENIAAKSDRLSQRREMDSVAPGQPRKRELPKVSAAPSRLLPPSQSAKPEVPSVNSMSASVVQHWQVQPDGRSARPAAPVPVISGGGFATNTAETSPVMSMTVGRSAQKSTEKVDVKYRGPVNLAPFGCTDVTRSSFIRRVCFDEVNGHMLINLSGVYYEYCGIDSATVAALMGADSMGRFYDTAIKGRFECRVHQPATHRVNARRDCEDGHWIDEVLDDGRLIKLEDDSLWEIDSLDTITSSLWLPVSNIIICGDRLINEDDNEAVDARRLR